MAITKPDWLHNYLLKFNRELFGINLPIGDLLELAVDHVLQQIDEVYIKAVAAWDAAVAAGEKVETVEQYLTNEMIREIEKVVTWIEGTFPPIRTLWETLKPQVLDMVSVYAQEVADLAREVDAAEDGFQVLEDRLREDYALRSWVIEALKSEETKREERLAELRTRIAAQEEKTEHWWDTLARFFADPWLFLVEEFIKWLTGNLETIFDTIETALWGEA